MAKHAHIFESDGPWRTETAACTRCGLSVRAYQAALDEDLEIAGEELGHIEAERDELAAQNAVLREALELIVAGDYCHREHGPFYHPYPTCATGVAIGALADPAPRADALLAVLGAAREWKRMHTGLHPQGGQTMILMREADQNLKDALARLDGKAEPTP